VDPWRSLGRQIAEGKFRSRTQTLEKLTMTYESEMQKQVDRDVNSDPLTDTPRAHRTGTDVSAATGSTALGAAECTGAGSEGALSSAAIGAVIGALVIKDAADLIDPALEETYWREDYTDRPYASGAGFDEYVPTYQYGADIHRKYSNSHFDDLEEELARGWEAYRDQSTLDWADAPARHATRGAV